jgi:hypothetical protein
MSGPVIRALPSRPDLEFERKQAKRLLRDAQHGDTDALNRIRAYQRGDVKLADAQLTIAREYGFRSWPLLVKYFESFARHEKSDIYRNDLGDGPKDWWVKTILAEHRDRRAWTAMVIGSFVPKFYGASVEEIFASSVTEEDAKLVVAREHGFARWDDMLAYQATVKKPDPWSSQSDPLRPFFQAIDARDVAELDRLRAEHGALLTPENLERLGSSALETRIPGRHISPAAIRWLRSIGADVQLLLNKRLRGFMGGHTDPGVVQTLLDLGGDPDWIAPNGYSVLEHALYRYWNGEAVDLLLARAKPRDTFWVSAGIGDVRRLRRYFDRAGKLTPSARKDRSDLMALSGHPDAILPEPDDATILWEAAFVAAVNGRRDAFDILLQHGFDVDDVRTGHTLLSFAVANGLLPMVELLVSRGANPDIRGWRPNQTPREMCVGYLGQNLENPEYRRIVELLGWDADELQREVDVRRGPPQHYPGLTQVLSFAMQDATRRGESRVGLESFLVGILAAPFSHNVIVFLGQGGVDLARLRERYQPRMAETSTNRNDLPYDEALQAALTAATGRAAEKREGVAPGAVLYFALESEPMAGIIGELGGDVQKVKEAMKRLLP